MLLNTHTALSTPTLLLVPYTPHHVPTYHVWMQSPCLRAATASEPLTLDEEYAMQKSWRRDGDKLTFIICLPLTFGSGKDGDVVSAGREDGEGRMIGDVNLFIFDAEADDNDDDEAAPSDQPDGVVGEIELMIASATHQSRGYGRAALVTFMAYVLETWTAIAAEYRRSQCRTLAQQAIVADKMTSTPARLEYLRAKILETNERSLALFKSVGFQVHGKGANYFGEVELRWQGELDEVKGLSGWEEGNVLEYREAER